MARIGIYGGSFNPPHIGHMQAADNARMQLGLDKVLIIPASIPPHKQIAEQSPDAKTRLKLTELAASRYAWFEVSDIELRRDGPSYTVDTLREIRSSYPTDQLFLLMGTDMFLSFHEWYKPEEICTMAELVCFERYQIDDKLLRKTLKQRDNLLKAYNATVTILGNPVVEISSTEIRRMLFFDLADRFLDRLVLEEIKNSNLYGVGKTYRNLSVDELQSTVFSLLKPKRVAHVEGCRELAVSLAHQYGADVESAVRAAVLHDVTKYLSTEDQLELLKHMNIDTSNEACRIPQLLHAVSGAAVADQIFGEKQEICDAIRWHSTGKPAMTNLEKIIYIADYAENTRTFNGVENIRSALSHSLDEGVLKGLHHTVEYLNSIDCPICSDTRDALDYLVKQQSNREELY